MGDVECMVSLQTENTLKFVVPYSDKFVDGHNQTSLSVTYFDGIVNEQAQERLDTIMEQLKAAEGVTEELKRTCQMEWVQRCNNIHNRAEEIVLHEMIYS